MNFLDSSLEDKLPKLLSSLRKGLLISNNLFHEQISEPTSVFFLPIVHR